LTSLIDSCLKMSKLYKMLRSSPETMQCMLQFAKSSHYIRLDSNNSVEAVNLQDHDTSFTFNVHVYEAVSMKDGRSMQQLYRFSCGDITLCGSPDGRRAKKTKTRRAWQSGDEAR